MCVVTKRGGGQVMFYHYKKKRGGGRKSIWGERGAKRFRPAVFPFSSTPLSVINDQSLTPDIYLDVSFWGSSCLIHFSFLDF